MWLGQGDHPRFFFTIVLREAVSAPLTYKRLLLWAHKLEEEFNSQHCNFQYIITTTEPPQEDLQTDHRGCLTPCLMRPCRKNGCSAWTSIRGSRCTTSIDETVADTIRRTTRICLIMDSCLDRCLDQLLIDSRLYTNSKDYKELLDFVVRLRNFAPFDASCFKFRSPVSSYAASARDWRERFQAAPEGTMPVHFLFFGHSVPWRLFTMCWTPRVNPYPEDVASFFARVHRR